MSAAAPRHRSRTIFVNGRFLTQGMTGVQRFAWENLMALDDLLVQGEAPGVELVVLAPRGTTRPPLQRIGFRTVGRLSGTAWEQLELPAASRGALLLGFAATGPLVKRRQCVTVHDAAVYRVPEAYGRPFRLWYKTALPLLLHLTPRTMTVSEFSRSELCSLLRVSKDKLSVSGEGSEHVDKVEPDVSILDEHGLYPRRYVLAVGSLSRHKNIEALAAAARALETEHEPVEVVVAGSADPRVFNGDGAPLGNVRLIGYVSDAQLRALYENAAVFVFPSRYEGFGIPPLEAMALGCPVIASNAAAIPETCGEAALYFSPDDPHRLAELLKQVLSDGALRRRLTEAGRAQARHHTWTRSARRYLDLLSAPHAPGQ